MKFEGVSKLCFATALSLSSSFAVTPSIGVASAFGTFTVNDAKVEGNANVFDGSQIKTAGASSRVYLENGALLTLGLTSSGTFYKDHVVLQQGATRVEGMTHYAVEAAHFRVQSAEPASEAVVRLNGGALEVAALAGALNVFSPQGALLKKIGAGTASSFQVGNTPSATGQSGPNAGQSGATPGQSGATAGQSGATAATPEDVRRRRRRQQEMLYVTLGVSLAGLGLATDAILQPGSGPAPTSP